MNILTEGELRRKLRDNLHLIKKGDRLGIDGQSGCPCSGGASYGLYEEVIEVTDDRVITNNGQYSIKSGEAMVPPWAYEIKWWIPTEKQ
jgi:hypothetical protein